MRRKLSLIIAVGALSMAVLACGGDNADDSAASTPTPPTSTSTTVPRATPTPDAADGTTGIDIVDTIVRAVRDGEYRVLDGLVQYETIGCTNATGAGGPPKCGDGEAEGTPIKAVQAASCEYYYAREGELVFELVGYGSPQGDGGVVHGVYRIGVSSDLLVYWPDAKYAVVLNRIGPADGLFVFTVFADEDGIVGVTSGCGESPADWVEKYGLSDAIVAPGN